MSKNLIFTVCLLCAAAASAGAADIAITSLPEPVVSNVRAAQRPGTIWVDIAYDVEYAGPFKALEVSVALSEDGGATYTMLSEGMTGDWGHGISPGKGKRMVWETGLSWLGRRSTNLLIRLSAIGILPGMVWIGPGKFRMGSPDGEEGRWGDEGPQTDVTLSRGYWLGKHEVRQREWEGVMGNNSSHFKGDRELPVESVSWAEAMEYCRKLTERERAAGGLPAGWEYRLPTEAQWEYACRGGTLTRYGFGDNDGELGRYAWYGGNSGGRTHPGGEKEPNGWGLYDMHGNVWEWCLDWYGDLHGGSVTDPSGPSSGSYRVLRGGSWLIGAPFCRSAIRGRHYPSYRFNSLGFRVALVQVP